MPRGLGRRRRLMLSFALTTGLVAAPAAVSADPLVRFDEHAVNLFCDAFGPEGELHLFAGVSSEFGPSANLEAWLGPVEPGSAPDFTGSSQNVVAIEAGGGATLSATIPLSDAGGAAAGDVVISATLTPTGDAFDVEPFRDGNRWIKTTGTIAVMEVSGTLDAPGDLPDFMLEDLDCSGEIVDLSVFETQPNAFVFGNEGTFIDCTWEDGDTFAHLFAVNDRFGLFAEVSLFVQGEHDILGSGTPLTVSSTSVEATIPLTDFLSGGQESATASASLSPMGGPVESTFVSQNFRQRLTEQRLIADGTLAFSTGDVFAMDAEHCFAVSFDIHHFDPAPSGPKAGGKPPANDTPEGAEPIRIGGVVNAQTRGAALDPELPITTCPAPDDALGHTLWYSFTGTGGQVTIDTAGSDFDTVVAVYDDELTELACEDDLAFEPIGGSFQAALTIDTLEGETYYVQAGGFAFDEFGEQIAEFGRLRIRVS